MKISRQISMLKAVTHSTKEKEEKQKNYYSLRKKVVQICNKYQMSLDLLDSKKLNKKEKSFVKEFYINQCGFTVAFIMYRNFFEN